MNGLKSVSSCYKRCIKESKKQDGKQFRPYHVTGSKQVSCNKEDKKSDKESTGELERRPEDERKGSQFQKDPHKTKAAEPETIVNKIEDNLRQPLVQYKRFAPGCVRKRVGFGKNIVVLDDIFACLYMKPYVITEDRLVKNPRKARQYESNHEDLPALYQCKSLTQHSVQISGT